MAKGRPPKPEGMRAGHGSIKSTKAILPADANLTVPPPPLPAHPLGEAWHPLALKTWLDIWQSPMASQFVDADIPGIFRIIVLTQAFMKTPTTNISAEIRQLSFSYGLSPMDRRRLQWTIVKADEALDAAVKRKARTKDKNVIDLDPRDALK